VPALGHHLLLDERERHGDQDQAEQQVAAAGDQLQLPVLRVRALERLAGHQVAEPDGGQGDEAEVSAVDERPALPSGEHRRAQAYVAEQHEKNQRDGHAGRRVVAPLGRRRRPLGRRFATTRLGRLLLPSVLVRLSSLLLLLTVIAGDQRYSTRGAVSSVDHLAVDNKNVG